MKFESKEFKKDGKIVRIELRAGNELNLGADMLVIIGPDGWDYKNEISTKKYGDYDREGSKWMRGTKGKNIRFSSNSPLNFSWNEWKLLTDEINRLTENF